MDSFAKMLALSLYDIGSAQFGAFKLKLHEKNPNAPLSPIYLNLRTPDNKNGPLQPIHVSAVAQCMRRVCEDAGLEFSAVAGVPKAGNPFAHSFVQGTEHGLIMLNKVEEDGKRRIAEVALGTWPKGATTLVIDDLITQADSKIECIRALEAADMKVKDVVVLVDREQGGREQLAQYGYQLHAVFTLTELLAFYVEQGKISAEKHDEVLAYIHSS